MKKKGPDHEISNICLICEIKEQMPEIKEQMSEIKEQISEKKVLEALK
jgi:hypothetical protein